MISCRAKLFKKPISDECGTTICYALSLEEQLKFFRVPNENVFNRVIFDIRFYVERELIRQ